jgi:hypothetical protein
MTRIPLLRRRRSTTITASAAEQADAEIRLADAGLARSIRARQAELDIAERELQVARQRSEERGRQRRREEQLRAAVRKRRRRFRQRGRRAKRAEMRARFEAALAGRLVMMLVAMAVATAWFGQYRFLREAMALGFLFAAAGATALELFGLSMFGIARDLGKYRHRALRVRVFGWAVIAFSAYSNFVHNGVALAAMSVAGPVAWEMHEWSQQRIRLHHEGKLATRPVRPRFPIDQVLLFPWRTLRAYRCAVRDRIEGVDEALALADRERQGRSRIDRVGSRSWTRTVRRSVAWHRKSMEYCNRQQSATIDRAYRHLDAIGPELRELSEQLRQIARLPAAASTDRSDVGRLTNPTRSTWRWRARDKAPQTDRAETQHVGANLSPNGPDGSSLHPLVRAGSVARKSAPVREQPDGRPCDRLTGRPAIRGSEVDGAATRAPADPAQHVGAEHPVSEGEPDRSSQSHAGSIVERADPQTRPIRPIRSIEELQVEARRLARELGWTSAKQVTADALRTRLYVGPKRARRLRDQLRQEFDRNALPDTEAAIEPVDVGTP